MAAHNPPSLKLWRDKNTIFLGKERSGINLALSKDNVAGYETRPFYEGNVDRSEFLYKIKNLH